jgi:hypothetical protein
MRKTIFFALTTIALTALLCWGASAQEKIFKFEISEKNLAVIAQALGKASYEQAAPVIADLQKQISEQQKSKEEPKEPQK